MDTNYFKVINVPPSERSGYVPGLEVTVYGGNT